MNIIHRGSSRLVVSCDRITSGQPGCVAEKCLLAPVCLGEHRDRVVRLSLRIFLINKSLLMHRNMC